MCGQSGCDCGSRCDCGQRHHHEGGRGCHGEKARCGCNDECACEQETGSCRCSGEAASCNCGHGKGEHHSHGHHACHSHSREHGRGFRRRFISRDERIAGLEAYLSELRAEAEAGTAYLKDIHAEATAVEERLVALKAA